MTEDENPDRLCEPQYHRKETIRLCVTADKALAGMQQQIAANEKRIYNELKPEKEKRYLELREWMRRDGLTDALYPLNDTQMLRAVVNKHYKTLTLTIMPIQRI